MLQMPPAALISSDKEDDKQKPHKVDGYTDGVYNYYAIGKNFSTSPVNQTLGAPVFSPLTFRTRPGRLPNRALMVARSGAAWLPRQSRGKAPV